MSNNTPKQNDEFRKAWDAVNTRYRAAENCSISWQVLIVYSDTPNETAILNCKTYKEAQDTKRSFDNYGKCKTVAIIQKVI